MTWGEAKFTSIMAALNSLNLNQLERIVILLFYEISALGSGYSSNFHANCTDQFFFLIDSNCPWTKNIIVHIKRSRSVFTWFSCHSKILNPSSIFSACKDFSYLQPSYCKQSNRWTEILGTLDISIGTFRNYNPLTVIKLMDSCRTKKKWCGLSRSERGLPLRVTSLTHTTEKKIEYHSQRMILFNKSRKK